MLLFSCVKLLCFSSFLLTKGFHAGNANHARICHSSPSCSCLQKPAIQPNHHQPCYSPECIDMPTHALPRNSSAHPRAWITAEFKARGKYRNLQSVKLKKMNPLVFLSAAKFLALHSHSITRLKSLLSANFETLSLFERHKIRCQGCLPLRHRHCLNRLNSHYENLKTKR